MPTYDYQCEACDHTFEHFQAITARPIRKCPACKANKLVRLIGTGGGIIFRGSGFYQTDYRSEEYKKAASAESKESKEGKKDKDSKDSKDSKGSGAKDKPSQGGQAGADAAGDSGTSKSKSEKK